jgi:hypothetical protein
MNFLKNYWEYIAIGTVIYLLPTLISLFNKKSKSSGIFLINLLAGWTVIMWISLLFEAFRDPSKNRSDEYRQNKVNEDFEGDDSSAFEIDSQDKFQSEKSSLIKDRGTRADHRGNSSSQKPSSSQPRKADESETIEIQAQQSRGNWTTLHSSNQNITNSNRLDQAISHDMDRISRIISNQFGYTGKVRARGKRTGTVYDINM